jgi:hypothetical protein
MKDDDEGRCRTNEELQLPEQHELPEIPALADDLPYPLGSASAECLAAETQQTPNTAVPQPELQTPMEIVTSPMQCELGECSTPTSDNQLISATPESPLLSPKVCCYCSDHCVVPRSTVVRCSPHCAAAEHLVSCCVSILCSVVPHAVTVLQAIQEYTYH